MSRRRVAVRLLFAALLIPCSSSGAIAEVPEAAKALVQSSKWQDRTKGLELLATRTGDEEAAKLAIERLSDVDWEVQIHAADALGQIGGATAQKALLRQAVEGDIHWVRLAAVRGLAGLGDPTSGERLLKRGRSERDSTLRERAIQVVGRLLPPENLSILRTYLGHKDVLVQRAAAEAVGDVVRRHPEIAPSALALLEPMWKLRGERRRFRAYAAAIEAAGRMDLPRARLRLITELLAQPDDDPYLQIRIARALAKMDPKKVRSAIHDLLPKASSVAAKRRLARLIGDAHLAVLADLLRSLLEGSYAEPTLQAVVLHSLGRLEATQYANDVRRVLDAQKDERVRALAVGTLARLLEPDAFRALSPKILADKSAEVRRQYIVELNDRNDPAAIPTLEAFTEDSDWRVASAAIAVIGTLGIADDLPRVLPLAKHRDWRIRAAAYEAMGRLRAADAIPHLAQGLVDRDPVVQDVCLANLQILSQERLTRDPRIWLEWFKKNRPKLHLRKRSRMTKEEIEQEEAERKRSRYAHDKYKFDRKRGLEILQKARILVVTGAWDHVEIVLEHLSVPHLALRAQELKIAGLNPNQVVLVNCEGNVDKDTQERIRWFVNIGGYLMTTDWALTKTVEPCFPGLMTQYSGSTTGNDVVVIEEAKPGHPYTLGVFGNVPALQWWLEVRAFPITVLDPERCEILVDSAEMRQRYGSSPLATTFRWGLGRVQHSVSHFFLQEEGLQKATKPRDRMIFAADHLGLSMDQIRELRESGAFQKRLNEETMREIAQDYSMFRLIVNFVAEKEAWVEGL